MSKQSELLTELAIILECDPKYSLLRVNFLGFGAYCTRCSGSGEHSWCSEYGTMCFKCLGSGKQMPNLTKKLLTEIKTKVDEGALEPYFENNRRLKWIKNQNKKIFAIWGESFVGKAYGMYWSMEGLRASSLFEINSKMAELTKQCGQITDKYHNRSIKLTPDEVLEDERIIKELMDQVKAIDLSLEETQEQVAIILNNSNESDLERYRKNKARYDNWHLKQNAS